MKRLTVPITAALICALMLGCSSSGPIVPGNEPNPAMGSATDSVRTQTHLWGYYDVYIDIPTKTATAVLNRQAAFTANVVNFVNGKPANMGFHINDTSVGPDYVEVDIDVTINHPFPGLPQYNGYDVRGVFMGDGSASLEYNPDLIYPVLGFDQFMLPDPDDGFGGPDGYTRWFNKPEFSTGGMPLFQYTQGKMASPGFAGTSTLNPYRYFADGLGANDDLWTWLIGHASQHGVFASGASNTRNYYLRFPNAKGVEFGYAIIANWAGEAPEFHPSNAPEAIALSVVDSSTVYYASPSDKGGAVKLDISVWDWDSKVSGGQMQDYTVFFESTVLTSVHEFSPSEMTPTGGGENYSTYHFEIPADNIQGNDGNEYWIIVEQKGHDYTNDFGVSNLADTDPLAAPFRFDLPVTSIPGNHNPICDFEVVNSLPVNGWDVGTPVEFDASGSTDPDGDPISFEWDFDNDGVFGESPDDDYTGAQDNPTHTYFQNYTGQVCVRVKDPNGGQAECCQSIQVVAHQSKNIPLRPDVDARDLGINPTNGTLYILYSDGQVWRYFPSQWYTQTGASSFYTTLTQYDRIDVHPDGSSALCGGSPTYGTRHFDPSGKLTGLWNIGYASIIRDVSFFPGTGSNGGDSCFIFKDTGNNGIFYHYFDPDFSSFSQHVLFLYVPYTGIGKFYSDWVTGIECLTNDAVWVVETTDFYAARFRLTETYPYGDIVYDDSYIGTGAQTDANDGFNNPLDLTIDTNDRVFILDKLSDNTPRIKVYDSSGAPAGFLFAFGNTSNISGMPLRIEGSDWVDPVYGNMIFVLHGSTPPNKLSIFFPSEMP